MYSLEKKDSNSDYTKRQILSVQENFKVFVPILCVLAAGLLALNIANALKNFLPIYACVAIDLVGVGAACGLLRSLIKGNIRQRNLFDRLAEREPDYGEELVSRYVSDTDGILKRANAVRIAETERAYVISPLLPVYKHRLFTRYDFRDDFGRLILPKDEYEAVEEEQAVRFVSATDEFVFAPLNEEKKQTRSAQ